MNSATQTFIDTIQDIYTTTPEKSNANIINVTLLRKQYIIYYLYRIICHHYNVFLSLTLVNNINQINKELGIPISYKYVCYPLANKMTTNIATLDNIFSLMIQLFTFANSKIINLKHKNILAPYFISKTKQSILTDIKHLAQLIPHLSSYKHP